MPTRTSCSISQDESITDMKVITNLVDGIIMATQEVKEEDTEDEEVSEVEEVVVTKEEVTIRTPTSTEMIQISIKEIKHKRNQIQPAENSLTTVISSAEHKYVAKTNKIRN